jgi:putative proteasome-type protease
MTFCLGIKLDSGLLAIADTRITSGNEFITARKLTIHEQNQHSLFLMTSGLRSVRDKAVTYFEEVLEEQVGKFDKLYKAVNAFAVQVRRVVAEDGEALRNANIWLNLYALVGGQLENDKEHKLYMIYPEGNWIESTPSSPYYIIGGSSYGKPILDRTLSHTDSLLQALKVGYLAFDASRASTTDVNFPLDIVIYQKNSYRMTQCRFTEEDFREISRWWQDWIRRGLVDIPVVWFDSLFSKLEAGDKESNPSK